MRPNLTSAGMLLLVSMGSALLLAGCKASEQEKEVQPEVTAQVAKVEAHDLEEHIVSDAVLFPRNQSAITPKITAPVAKFYVQRGDHVRAGQLLVVLDNRDLSAAVVESQGGLQQSEATYVTATKAGIPEEVQKAQLDLQQSKEMLDAQSAILNSRKQLFQEGALPRKDLDAAQVAYVQAKAAYDIAAQHLKSLEAVSREQEVKTATAQLTAAKGKYQGAEAQLRFSEIRSPISGVVTERNWFAGETPAAGATLITVMDTSSIIAKAHVPQAAAQQVKVGAPAEVTVAGSDQPIEGKVTLVSPALDPGSTTVELWVTVDNRKGQLKPGSAAKINIIAHRAKDALAIPAQALVQSDKGPTVMLVGSDDVAHAQAVQTGIQDAEQGLVQITSGLKAGDNVVASAAYGLPDGAKVKAAEPAAPAGAEPDKADTDKPAAAKPSGGKE